MKALLRALCALALGLGSFIAFDVARIAVFPPRFTMIIDSRSVSPGGSLETIVTPVLIGPCPLRIFWDVERKFSFDSVVNIYASQPPFGAGPRSLARRLPDEFGIDPLRLLITLAWSTVLFAAWTGWRRFRYPPGRCRTCDYDLSALAAEARCPECGTAR